MKGTSAMPKKPTAAAMTSLPGPPKRLSNRYALKTIHMTKVLVTRGSHTHQTPQDLRAHNGPVTSTINPNTTVNSADETATRSAPGRRVKRYTALAVPQIIADSIIVIAAGKWK